MQGGSRAARSLTERSEAGKGGVPGRAEDPKTQGDTAGPEGQGEANSLQNQGGDEARKTMWSWSD